MDERFARWQVLLLPGWLDSGPGHWQTRWEARCGFRRVPQHDWLWPRRGDWMTQLEEAVLAAERPVLLAAHSLGCHLVAAWAAHSACAARVVGALLVAPPDLERDDMPPNLIGWRPVVRRPLPFACRLVLSDDDPFASAEAARSLASSWGAEAVSIGCAGHINADSGLGGWPEGLQWLRALPSSSVPPLLPPQGRP